MGARNNPQQSSFNNDKNKDTEKKNQLREYLRLLEFHPPINKHLEIASIFGVYKYRDIFREDAINRFIEAIYSEPTTTATVSEITGIKHKYLCQLKRLLENNEMLKVVGLGSCPTTTSNNVQFLSSNTIYWSEVYPKSNQLKLF